MHAGHNNADSKMCIRKLCSTLNCA